MCVVLGMGLDAVLREPFSMIRGGPGGSSGADPGAQGSSQARTRSMGQGEDVDGDSSGARIYLRQKLHTRRTSPVESRATEGAGVGAVLRRMPSRIMNGSRRAPSEPMAR